MSTRETDEEFEAKQDDENNNISTEEIIIRSTTANNKSSARASSSNTNSASASASASSWSRLKDPRIVRVSRAFGGKDRHSKVCTVRGLRDRRVRLSVPTAIQLYDLQDRLNLNQPSKVVDWLLNAAKSEIDELPPLPSIPAPGNCFDHNLQPILSSNKEGSSSSLRIGANINWEDHHQPSGSNNAWSNSDHHALFRPKSSKEVARDDEEDQRKQQEQQQQSQSHDFESQRSAYFSSNNFFSRLDQSSASSSLGFLNGGGINTMPSLNSLVRWDPSNLSLSQSGTSGLTPTQQEDFHNFGVLPLQSSTLLPSGSHQQVLVYHQPGTTSTTQSYFPSHIAEFGGGGIRPFHLLGTTTKLLPSQDDHHHHHQHHQDKQNEDDNFHSR